MPKRKPQLNQPLLEFEAPKVTKSTKLWLHVTCNKRKVVEREPDAIGSTHYCLHCKLYIHPAYVKEKIQ